jgi:spermidine/putrescine transport system permease protein
MIWGCAGADGMTVMTGSRVEHDATEAAPHASALTRGITPYLQLAPLVMLMLVFALVPLLGMLAITFFKSGIFGLEPHLTLSNYAKFMDESTYVRVLIKSMRMAFVVTAATILISYPVAFWLAKVVTRHKLLFLIILFAPYWVNYVIRSYAWLPLLGNSGIINSFLLATGIIDQPLSWMLYNEFSVILVLIYVFLPFGIVPLYLSIDRISNDLLAASADLDATPMMTFVHVVLPLSMPGLAGSFLTVFVLTIGAYVTPKLVGGTTGIMFGNLIADQFGITYNWTWGATLAVILACVTGAVVWLVSRRVPITRVFVQN